MREERKADTRHISGGEPTALHKGRKCQDKDKVEEDGSSDLHKEQKHRTGRRRGTIRRGRSRRGRSRSRSRRKGSLGTWRAKVWYA